MLHREIGAIPEVGVRLRGVIQSGLPGSDPQPGWALPVTAQACGPLGRAVRRMLGVGPGQQTWQGAIHQHVDGMFARPTAAVSGAGMPFLAGGSAPTAGLSQAWLAARALPTPNGAYRAVVVPM